MPHYKWFLFTQGEKKDISNMVTKGNGLNFAPGIIAPPTEAISHNNGSHISPLPLEPSAASQWRTPTKQQPIQLQQCHQRPWRLGSATLLLLIKQKITPGNVKLPNPQDSCPQLSSVHISPGHTLIKHNPTLTCSCLQTTNYI